MNENHIFRRLMYFLNLGGEKRLYWKSTNPQFLKPSFADGEVYGAVVVCEIY